MWWAFVLVLFTSSGQIAGPAQVMRFPVETACEQTRAAVTVAVQGLPVAVAPVCVPVSSPTTGLAQAPHGSEVSSSTPDH